jgi:hypothetical protein
VPGFLAHYPGVSPFGLYPRLPICEPFGFKLIPCKRALFESIPLDQWFRAQIDSVDQWFRARIDSVDQWFRAQIDSVDQWLRAQIDKEAGTVVLLGRGLLHPFRVPGFLAHYPGVSPFGLYPRLPICEPFGFKSIPCKRALFESIPCKRALFKSIPCKRALFESIPCKRALFESIPWISGFGLKLIPWINAWARIDSVDQWFRAQIDSVRMWPCLCED